MPIRTRAQRPWVEKASHLFALVILFTGVVAMAPAQAESAEIVLGMSTALTGPASALGQNMKSGVLTGLERVNQSGGVNGRRIKLIALDDGYEPVRTAPNMRRLLEQDRVLAVIGNVGTPTAIAALPIANEQKTLLFAAFTGAGVLRKSPPDRYVINYRASYAEETGAMIDALITHGGLAPTDIAFFTQRDGYGDAGYVGGIAALRRNGLQDEREIMHVRYERNTLAVENALADILLAPRIPKAVIMVGAYAPCAKFINLAREHGLESLFLNLSFVGSGALASALNRGEEKVIVTQVVPHPQDETLPLVREYREDLKLFSPEMAPDFGSLEGYLAARIFSSALQRIKGKPNREAVVQALESLGSFDPGIGITLSLEAEDHQASNHVWATYINDGAFAPFDWTNINDLLMPPTIQ